MLTHHACVLFTRHLSTTLPRASDAPASELLSWALAAISIRSASEPLIGRPDQVCRIQFCGARGGFQPPTRRQAAGMDLGRLRRAYGCDLCFHGGIDIQGVLPHGRPEQVREHVCRQIAAAGSEGGYILCPPTTSSPIRRWRTCWRYLPRTRSPGRGTRFGTLIKWKGLPSLLTAAPQCSVFGGLAAAAALLLLVLLLVVFLGASTAALRFAAHSCHLPRAELRVRVQCALRGSVVGRWSRTPHHRVVDVPGGRMFIRDEVIPVVTVCTGRAQAA